jgi:hypothetical protein
MKLPSKAKVVAALAEVFAEADWDLINEEGDEAGLDVRLQVYDDGGWALRWGLSDYDLDHRGHWGASGLTSDMSRADLKQIAEELIDQVEESVATSE